jgi:mRNA-degrading endonuclease RelE of RelBE toxin-antitoxin system
MSDKEPLIEIQFTTHFHKALKQLSKKYRQIRADLGLLIVQLQAGEIVGDQLMGMEDRIIYKARIINSDTGRGKSGGYRVIYYIVTQDLIRLVTLYSKTEQEDIGATEIIEIINKTETEFQDNIN